MICEAGFYLPNLQVITSSDWDTCIAFRALKVSACVIMKMLTCDDVRLSHYLQTLKAVM